MTEQMETILRLLLEGACFRETGAFEEACDQAEILDVRSFENAGVMTDAKGFVVRIEKDGQESEFQITIVQSR